MPQSDFIFNFPGFLSYVIFVGMPILAYGQSCHVSYPTKQNEEKVADLHRRVPLLRQPLEVLAGLDPDGHGRVDLFDRLIMLALNLQQECRKKAKIK
jgi:hypothetical protein